MYGRWILVAKVKKPYFCGFVGYVEVSYFVMFTLFVQQKQKEMGSNIREVVMSLLGEMEESSDDLSIFNCTDSTDSSLSSDSDDETPYIKKARVANYVDVIGNYTDLQFKKHFRLTTGVAERIMGEYSKFLHRPSHGGRTAVGADVHIYIMLWFLANTETYRQIADRFDVTESSVHRILYRVVKWFVKVSPKYIKWPTASEMQNNQIQFAAMKGVPGVVGAIDGCHIKINAPKRDKQAYCNKKKYYSVLLQGIVNAEKKFIDVHCGEPGAMHDTRLLRKSGFYRRISEDDSIIIAGGVLLGDSAYAASRYLVPPFKDFGNLTAKQVKFNYLYSATRIVVENAFGLLKCRFRRLHFFESRNLCFVTNCIVAACVLHNICIAENDFCDIEYLDNEVNNIQNYTESEGIDSNNGACARQEMFENMDNNGLLN